MIKRTAAILSFMAIATTLPAFSQSSSSSSESYYRGPGSTGANVFVPKYNERLKNWSEQISKAQTNGWLAQTEVDHFLAEHARLSALNKTLESSGYPKAETDDLEKQFTAFNISLSKAMSKSSSATPPNATPAIPAKPAVPATKTNGPTPPTAPSKKKVVTKTTTKAQSKAK